MLKTFLLFFVTAIAEIVGCYLPYLWLQKGKSILLLLPAAVSLTAFVFLLSLHPVGSGRVYAAYGGIYVFVSLLWILFVDRIRLSTTDIVGIVVILVGTAIIIAGYGKNQV